MTDEPFRLANDKPPAKPQPFATSDRTRQQILFTGLDCMPGQLDLFRTNVFPSDEHHEE
jgi:hypothetical protein